MTFFPSACSFCPCTRPTDHAPMSAAATPTTNSDLFIRSSLFRILDSNPRRTHSTLATEQALPARLPALSVPLHEKRVPHALRPLRSVGFHRCTILGFLFIDPTACHPERSNCFAFAKQSRSRRIPYPL